MRITRHLLLLGCCRRASRGQHSCLKSESVLKSTHPRPVQRALRRRLESVDHVVQFGNLPRRDHLLRNRSTRPCPSSFHRRLEQPRRVVVDKLRRRGRERGSIHRLRALTRSSWGGGTSLHSRYAERPGGDAVDFGSSDRRLGLARHHGRAGLFVRRLVVILCRCRRWLRKTGVCVVGVSEIASVTVRRVVSTYWFSRNVSPMLLRR